MQAPTDITNSIQQALQSIWLGDPDQALDALRVLMPDLRDKVLLEQLYTLSGQWHANACNGNMQAMRQDDMNLFRTQTLQSLMGLVQMICQQEGLDVYGLVGGVG